MKHRMKTLLATFGGALVLSVASASAETLAFYDIQFNLLQDDSAGATGVTASPIDATSATGTSSFYNWQGSRSPYFSNSAIGDGTDPQISDIAVTWSMTPDSGNKIELATTGAINVDLLAASSLQTGGGSYSVYARVFIASDEAFTNILATSEVMSDTETGETSESAAADVTTGSAVLDQAVSSDGTLYFGLAFLEDLSSSTAIFGTKLHFDAIQVNGTVADIPEPSSLALLGLGGLLAVRGRTHKRA